MKDASTTKETIQQKAAETKAAFRKQVDSINTWFNGLPIRSRKIALLFFGMSIALCCVGLMYHAITANTGIKIFIEPITQPNDIYMAPSKDTTRLSPVGKLKGEIDNQFEAFYVAKDKSGQHYINHNPSYGQDRYLLSKDWTAISDQQLETLKKELHFIPAPQKGLKR
jgi:hypothetical protein